MKSKGHTLGIKLVESTPQETGEGTKGEDMEDVEMEGNDPDVIWSKTRPRVRGTLLAVKSPTGWFILTTGKDLLGLQGETEAEKQGRKEGRK